MKGREFFEQLSDHQLLNMDLFPLNSVSEIFHIVIFLPERISSIRYYYQTPICPSTLVFHLRIQRPGFDIFGVVGAC